MSFKNHFKTRLIILLIMIEFSFSQNCSKGCLSCGSDFKCKICDTPKFFALDNSRCRSVTELENCLSIDSNGKCLQCVANYYVDLSTQKCVVVEALIQIDNCSVYSSNKTCIYCKSGFYVVNSTCVKSANILEKCEIQFDDKSCLTCKPGFFMKLDGSGCSSLPAGASDCLNYSLVTCKNCLSGYILDYNKYIKDFKTSLNSSAAADELVATVMYEQTKNVNKGLSAMCIQPVMIGCIDFETSSKCKTCDNGYYLTTQGICETNPVQIISNCKTYVSTKTCKVCESGYHLTETAQCTANSRIESCQNYDNTAYESSCKECLDVYYLSSSTSCTSRTKTGIVNCQTYKINADKCGECSDGYNLTGDGLACLKSIQNCKTYVSSTVSSPALSCSVCNSGYYKEEETKCKEGSIKNCKTYDSSADICNECELGFYLESSNVCAAHKTISYCEVYDQLIKDTCTTCNNKSLAFTISNKCALAKQITGCIKFSSETACKTCGVGYLFDNATKTCVLIPANLNCLEATSIDVCVKCKPSYILHDSTCKLFPSQIQEQCSKNNADSGIETILSVKCNYCLETNIMWNFENEFACLDNKWVSTLQNVNIPHCSQFDMSGATTLCRRCNDGYFLSGNSCVLTCSASPIIFSQLLKNESLYQIKNGKFCQSASFTGKMDNCSVYAYANNTVNGDINGDPVCVKCLDNYGKVIDPTSPNSTGMEDGSLIENLSWQFSSPVSFLPKVISCISLASTSTNTMLLATSGNKYIEGCEYYARIGTTVKYGCIRCQTGKRGTLASSSDGYFISSCSTTTCNSSFIPGLQSEINAYLSCYKCTESTSIPFLFIKGGTAYTTITGYASYNLSATGANWDNVTSGGYSVNCHPKNGGGFTNVTNYNLPINCAIAAFNVESVTASAENANKTNLASTANLAVFCLACDPGFKRTFATDSSNAVIPYVVYQCTSISNCLVKDWFNYCSLCNNNYAFAYSDTNGVDFTNCVPYPADSNCFATYAQDSGPCAICKKGYVLNYDGICEALIVPFCQSDKFDHTRKFKRIDFNTIFYLSPLGRGCHKCRTGYTPVYSNIAPKLCSPSSYLSKLYTLSTTNYILNCNNYYLDNSTLKCINCANGYVLMTTYAKCLPATQLTNCKLASSNTECQTCNDGFLNISKKCQKMGIENCISYNLSSDQISQTCLDCTDGYYVSNNKCIKGQISNCIRFMSNGDGCSKCMGGFELVKATNKDYCFKTPTDMNCEKYDSDRFRSNVLECTLCSYLTPLYITTAMTNETTFRCVPLVESSSCLSYNNTGRFSSSVLDCNSCALGYYLKNGVCLARSIQMNECKVYSPSEDLCITCIVGYYSTGNKCVLNPSGINDCRSYQQPSVCISCNSNFYLDNNKCIAVSIPNLIINCLYYASASACSECKSGFGLVDNKCIETKASNCLTVKSETECASCSPDRGLKTDSGLTSCVVNSDSNCIEFTQPFPFVCKTCKAAFYPNSSGVCTKVDKGISNCAIYDSATTCLKCNKGFALRIEKDSCSNTSNLKKFISSTCDNSIIQLTPVCTQCPGGYTFDETGNCVKTCKDGCHFCDPENTSMCLICSSGIYMNTPGICAVSAVDNSGTSSIKLTEVLIFALILQAMF